MTLWIVLTRPMWEHGATVLHAFLDSCDAYRYAMAVLGDDPGDWTREGDESIWVDKDRQKVVFIQSCPSDINGMP